jgi:DNA-directed RNA polymerase specialized sigma24 family protein
LKNLSQTFPETSWTLVIQAGGGGDSSVERAARERFFAAYWMPVYGYLRRRGLAHAEAEDQTQGVFARLIANDGLATADPARGRFRTFLLRCVFNHLAKAREHATAARRDVRLGFALDALPSAEAERLLAIDGLGAEEVFDLAWARQKLGEAVEVVREEWTRRGRATVFAALRELLLQSPEAGDYAAAASVAGLSEGAVKVEVFRLRSRLREVFRARVASTVTDVEEVEEEARHLLNLLARHGIRSP